MPHAHANCITIEYAVSGPADGAPILLVHGVGAQLIRWPAELVDGLVAAGFRVIRFDNRDIGLSTHFPEAGVPDLAAALDAKARGDVPALPYHLDDMAADTIGLLDALGIDRAHLVGVSLGGMIVQQVAIAAPARVRSLAILMSQSGAAGLPPSDPAALAILSAPSPDPAADPEAFLAHAVALNRALGSPLYPTDDAVLRDFAARAAARAHDPAGSARQLAAGRASPDRSAGLARLAVPTLVVHGRDDRLIPLAAGEDIAARVPGAWLLTISGMGHDIPAALCPLLVMMITSNAKRLTAIAGSPPAR